MLTPDYPNISSNKLVVVLLLTGIFLIIISIFQKIIEKKSNSV